MSPGLMACSLPGVPGQHLAGSQHLKVEMIETVAPQARAIAMVGRPGDDSIEEQKAREAIRDHGGL